MKNRAFIISILFGLMIQNGLAQDEHKKAYQLFKQGKYQDAITFANEAIASYPDWWFPVFIKGECSLKLKDYKGALDSFNDALTLEPDSKEIPKIRYSIANTYMAMEDYAKASHAYTQLVPLVPASKHFDVYFNRGQCEMQLAKNAEDSGKADANSNYSKAVVSFTEALKQKTNNNSAQLEASFQKAYAQYKIGNFKGGIGSLEKSIQAFADVIAENPKEKRAHKFIINLAFEVVEESKDTQKQAQYLKTVDYINRYLSHWPDDSSVIFQKGQALQGAKKYAEAIDVFQSLAQKNPKDGAIYFSLGSCQMANKQYPLAIGSFQKAMSYGEEKNPNVYTYSAFCYQQQKTGCDQRDIPLYENAIKILEKGGKVVSGQGKVALNRDLSQKRDNLEILRSNMATDSQNHLTAIENIQELTNSLNANKTTLAKNQDQYIAQPTEELKKAVEEGKAAIRQDEKSLAEQYKQIEEYVQNAKRCGGGATYPYYEKMVQLIRQKA